MARPRRLRTIVSIPEITYFKPQGVPLRSLQEVTITLPEYEALRLKDYEKLDQNESSQKMEISQPTFNRLYATAREKITKALIEGLAIKIEGGNYKMPNRDGTGPEGKGPRTGKGLGHCEPQENETLARGRGLGPGRRPKRGQGLGRRQN